MRLKRAIKRIVALGTGVTMVGATLLGAMAAADLSDYPAPFVADGAFNALIVVGAAAKTEDVLGATDIATSLQFANTVTKTVPGTGTTVSVVGEGFKIETGSNKVTIGESLQSVKSSIDEDELPNLLAKGTFVGDGDDESTEYAYEQKLEFGPNDNATVTWLRDDEYDEEENPHVVLMSPKAGGSDTNFFMKYTLDFSKDAESDYYTGTTCGSANELCDIEDAKIEIMGVEYEITKAEWESPKLTWEMMGGVSLNTMYEGDTKTFTVNGVDYEVTVDIISDTGSADETVILTVNGQSTKELGADQTQTVAGIEVGIKQVMGNEAGEANAGKDLVQFYLGAQKVVLTDNYVTSTYDTEMKIGGTEIDGLYVDWTLSGGTGNGVEVKLQKLELTWRPEDKVFVGEGSPVSFPGLGNFDVVYSGLTTDGTAETIKLQASGSDNMQLSVPLEAGTTTFDLLYFDGTNYTSYGKTATTGDGLMWLTTGTIKEGDYILLTSIDERETHIVELDNVNNDNVTRLKDLADGTKYEATCTTGCTINVGDLSADFSSPDPAADQITLDTAGSDLGTEIFTKEGLTINLSSLTVGNVATKTITFVEEDQNGALAAGNSFDVVLGSAGTGTVKPSVQSVTDSTSTFEREIGQNPNLEYGDTDKEGWLTYFGTEVLHDQSGDYYELIVTYPGEEAHANVFVNSKSAVVTEGGAGGTYDEVQRVEVGAAVLDTEVASLDAQNTIVVGGPCVNTLAAELMGNPAVCTEGFEMGKAMIKLFEHDNGNVALLVAGYSGMDSRRAARVVAEYDSYDNFAGTELEVTGTSLTDISVGLPTPAEEEAVVEEAEEEAAEETAEE